MSLPLGAATFSTLLKAGASANLVAPNSLSCIRLQMGGGGALVIIFWVRLETWEVREACRTQFFEENCWGTKRETNASETM